MNNNNFDELLTLYFFSATIIFNIFYTTMYLCLVVSNYIYALRASHKFINSFVR